MRNQAYVDNNACGGFNRRRLITTVLRRSTLGLAALGASVSYHALAQSLASADPANWRTPEYRADWGLEAMRAADAYAAGYTGLGVIVGVVDSGVYSDHPEFANGHVKPLTITGTFGSDGYYFQDWYGQPQDSWPQPSFFKTGDAYTVPGAYDARYNDPHGTHVTGTVAAARDGTGMHGVAFDADVYVTNTHSTDETRYGPNADYAYFKNAYGTLAAAGARVINSSWGSPPVGDNYDSLAGVRSAYSRFDGKLGLLDAMADVTKRYDVIQVIAAGNTGYSNPNVRSSLPYLRPDLERNWLAVGGAEAGANGSLNSADLILSSYSNRAGIAKYWYVVAPGTAITSTAPPWVPGAPWDAAEWQIDPDNQTGYTRVDGTSMAAPHATGALAVIMQRYPYMTNQQARDVLLTTAYHRNAVDGIPDANPNAPNAVWGWGVIDLNKAMKGPGQFLGPVAANLPTGTRDIWSNDISEDALVQRKQEKDPGAAAWADHGSLIKLGGGTLTLTGANTYAGGTTFAGGTLSVSRDANLGAAVAPLTFDGGILRVTGTGFTATTRPITWANGGGGLDIADPANTFTLTQSLAGSGGLAKLGAGTLALSGINTYAGPTTIAAGTLLAGGGQAIGDRSAVLVGAGATLALADSEIVGSLAGQGRVALGAARLTAGGDNSSTSFSGTMDGAGGLTKAGAGTLTLAGSNTYTGGTTIAAGTLQVGNGGTSGSLVGDV
ncbi:autotransporter-associated beta strand repeat-containing protein, partial [Methylobacterium brachiatum]